MKKRLIVIGGATATGKTALAIWLAQRLGTEILSADSRQFYREMSIGTAKPSPVELAAAPHHFVDSLSVREGFSVGAFVEQAQALLTHIYLRRDVAILVGGSGLYLRAVCEGLDRFPEVPDTVRQAVALGEQTGGLPWLRAELERLDPAYYAVVDRQNPARLRRALEVCMAGAEPYSHYLNGAKRPMPFEPVQLLLDLPRTELYARIDARVEAMLAAGLEEEARALWPLKGLSALRTVGYEEFFDYFEGKMDYAETVEKIKQHSRNYAKRQATWFRKHGTWQVFHPEDRRGIADWLDGILR